MKNFIALTFVLIGITACATAPDAPVTDIRSVGLISLLGDELKIISVGTTVFNNEDSDGDVSSWNVDGKVLDEMQSHLENTYSVQIVDVDKNAMISDYKAEGDRLAGSFFGGESKFVLSDAIEQHRFDQQTLDGFNQAPDAYVVVIMAPQNNYGMRGNPDLTGYGIYSSSMFGMGSSVLFLGARLTVIDAKTKEEIRNRWFVPGYAMSGDRKRECMDCYGRALDKDLVVRKFDEFTPEQLEALKAELFVMLEDSVKHSLAVVGLLPMSEETAESGDSAP